MSQVQDDINSMVYYYLFHVKQKNYYKTLLRQNSFQ